MHMLAFSIDTIFFADLRIDNIDNIQKVRSEAFVIQGGETRFYAIGKCDDGSDIGIEQINPYIDLPLIYSIPAK